MQKYFVKPGKKHNKWVALTYLVYCAEAEVKIKSIYIKISCLWICGSVDQVDVMTSKTTKKLKTNKKNKKAKKLKKIKN